MPEFCTCGAQLPPDARFCHKCGKPQYDYPGVEETEQAQAPPPLPPPLPDAVAAARAAQEISFRNKTAVGIGFMVAVAAMLAFLLPGGLLFPILRLIVGFFLAGFFATKWYARRTGQPLSIRSGARMGWITGIFSFAMFVALFTVQVISLSNEGGLVAFYKKQMPTQDPNIEQIMKGLGDPVISAVLIIAALVMFFVLFTTLPMLGGAVGAKLSDRRA
ncbi:MAG: zinc-ribbon domain-containing protein [Bryobacteraceae bacterium]